ncbi:MAG: helix-turn-helix domain-containing protein [Gammaproteobacteria bacterium]|nr:helix-turn-helix domain-containing protein [Gammaproteobacteria bacterium]
MIDDLTTDEPSLSSKASPGMILAAARDELKWSIEDVAANLNLRVSVIEALERDDYGDLPGPTFVRGYIRAYARLLGIDEVGGRR